MDEKLSIKEAFAKMTEDEIREWLIDYGQGFCTGQMKAARVIMVALSAIVGAETMFIAERIVKKLKEKKK